MTRYRVETTPDADEHARTIHDWWRTERARPLLFLEELTAVLGLLAEMPTIGAPYRGDGVPEDIRRILLRRSGVHIYYRVDTQAHAVLVVALWHVARGSMPPL